MNKKLKKKHLFEVENLCNNKNVFTITFDPFNASLLKKIIIYKK